MKEMKKIIYSILLLIALLLIPRVVLATETIEQWKSAKIGDKEYQTLTEAISAVPADGKEVTIKLLRDVKEEAEGFKIQDGQNIVIDFEGHTYNASKPLVGSTETNGCQLLKGAKVTLKNGKLMSTTAKVLLQNYCDLVIEDMMIDESKNQKNMYVLSNNNGKVEIKGSTSIIAREGQVAFDICWAPNSNEYKGGTQVTVDTTGTITGNIEFGLWNKDDSVENSKSTLLIKNVKHYGKFVFAKEKLKENLTIKGGIFNQDVREYLLENYFTRKQADGTYIVKQIFNTSNCDIKGITNKTYTGEILTQNIVVTVDGKTLKNDIDYIVSYSNNQNPGKATIVITGKDHYEGTITKSFIITPMKIVELKVSEQTTSTVKLSWSNHKGVTGYKVYSYNYSTKKWEYVGKTNKTSYTVKDLKSGTTYKYRVRAYKTIDGTQHFGAYTTNMRTATKPKTPSANVKVGDKKVTLKWSKVSPATGYEVYVKTNKNGKYKLLKRINKNSTIEYTNSKLAVNKTHYIKVRAYKTVDGKRIYGSYSKEKTIKFKKTYKIKKGDSLSKLAKKYKTTVSKILKLNNIKNKNSISIGKIIRIF
ncbi:MAG: LysM peptidoglycan-binding domain-containing protein [Clostridia bacterium]|nr:LysM peptidoglycan-binding domain-containing protein [Clostridia bacterium]